MDEDLAIVAENTRKEQVKKFLIKQRKKIFLGLGLILIVIFSIFFYLDNIKKERINIANKFIQASLNYDEKKEDFYLKEFNEIIDTHDSTYSILALFFVVDNKISESNEKINSLFDKVINEVKLEEEIKNLVIYKKALFNADIKSENEMLEMLKPLTNSKSFWKPHALLLLGDYFLSKREKQKAKDFYSQILKLEINNNNIYNQTLIRIQKNYGE